jgi:hypothetical protein
VSIQLRTITARVFCPEKIVSTASIFRLVMLSRHRPEGLLRFSAALDPDRRGEFPKWRINLPHPLWRGAQNLGREFQLPMGAKRKIYSVTHCARSTNLLSLNLRLKLSARRRPIRLKRVSINR